MFPKLQITPTPSLWKDNKANLPLILREVKSFCVSEELFANTSPFLGDLPHLLPPVHSQDLREICVKKQKKLTLK